MTLISSTKPTSDVTALILARLHELQKLCPRGSCVTLFIRVPQDPSGANDLLFSQESPADQPRMHVALARKMATVPFQAHVADEPKGSGDARPRKRCAHQFSDVADSQNSHPCKRDGGCGFTFYLGRGTYQDQANAWDTGKSEGV